jgi:glyoxylase-like metal-dependent hydrolase (beta-lactamase superfamily II)
MLLQNPSWRKAKTAMKYKAFPLTDYYKNFSLIEGGHVPAFVCKNDPPIIFDPGVSAFGPLYYRTLLPLMPKQQHLLILLTHSHFDHCGAAPYLLRKFPGTQLGASIRAAEVLQKQSAIDLIRRFNAEYEEKMADDIKGEDTSFSGIIVDMHLQEGDRVELANGHCFQVFETPGHTRDCLSYFFPDTGVLVAGEAAGVPEGDFIHSVFLASYEDYANSIEKLRAIEAEALCIAHVGILTGRSQIVQYLTASLAAAQEYRLKIERYLERFNGDKQEVVDTIVTEEYDSKQHHLLNRNPFITNLQAKINAICKLAEKKQINRLH